MLHSVSPHNTFLVMRRYKRSLVVCTFEYYHERIIKNTPYRRGFLRKLIVAHIIHNSLYFRNPKINNRVNL